MDDESERLQIIDQTHLPFELRIRTLSTVDEVAEAIRSMRVRGAPLIGAVAAHGLALALAEDPTDMGLARAEGILSRTRPTAVDLFWALQRVTRAVRGVAPCDRAAHARAQAIAVCEGSVETCSAIGDHGLETLRRMSASVGGRALEILTHCNAGWLATVDWGTALAPIYKAFDAGIPLHVWVDETRPRNQGSMLTSFELGEHGVPHTVIVDNAGGHLMQRGKIDCVIVGSDRTTATGDVCNKIGTYLKALAAREAGVPFFVALPTSTIDWSLRDGIAEIPIEERSADEVRCVSGRTADGSMASVELFSERTRVSNPGFDVTPAVLVTGLVTEHGVFDATEEALRRLREKMERSSSSIDAGPGSRAPA